MEVDSSPVKSSAKKIDSQPVNFSQFQVVLGKVFRVGLKARLC